MKRLPLIAFFLSAISCLAQSSISSTDRYAYSANAGWIDFGDTVSLTLTPNGQPAINFYDANNGDLKFALRGFSNRLLD